MDLVVTARVKASADHVGSFIADRDRLAGWAEVATPPKVDVDPSNAPASTRPGICRGFRPGRVADRSELCAMCGAREATGRGGRCGACRAALPAG
jgi:hypothetical protein